MKTKKQIKKLDEKRIFKGYKIPLSIYNKCRVKAAKSGTTLANVIEDYLYDYAE